MEEPSIINEESERESTQHTEQQDKGDDDE